jgi:hypothetical protein
MLPLAEIPEGNVLKDWMIAAGFLMNFALTAVMFAKLLRNEPQRREVSFAETYATKTEHEGLRGEFAEFRDEVRVSFDDAADQSRTSREKIYVEQRRQAELLAANMQKTELTHQRVETLDTKLDRILERIAGK